MLNVVCQSGLASALTRDARRDTLRDAVFPCGKTLCHTGASAQAEQLRKGGCWRLLLSTGFNGFSTLAEGYGCRRTTCFVDFENVLRSERAALFA